MNSQQLGQITMRFSKRSGVFLGSTFKGCELDSIPHVADLKTSKNENDLCRLAELILANSFAVVNKIELADREKYKLKSTPIYVERKDDGLITDITIAFSLEEI